MKTEDVTVERVELQINGETISVDVKPAALLLDVLRELGLQGAKRGCETSHCGACTVLLDGRAVHSCVVLALRAEGKEIATIEGLGADGELHDLQKYFLKFGALQCGYCTPGMILAGKALVDHNPKPTLQDVRTALDGNLCRCTGYTSIFNAVLAYAESRGKE
ncbi:MAG: (2Fe-2S)-binding protein [Deltaproteobacteria bacterium]|nr:(2Fe-2S)-binding protein [Deltaproteobacteria bacterium]